MQDPARRGRRVTGALLVALTAGWLVLMAMWLGDAKPELLHTNSMERAATIATATARQQVCAHRQLIPQGSSRVEVDVRTLRDDGSIEPIEHRLSVSVLADGRSYHGAGTAPPGVERLSAPLDRAVARTDVDGTVCVRASAGRVGLSGSSSVFGYTTVNGKRVGENEAMRLSFYSSVSRSPISQASTVLKRASMYRPAWVGPWTFVLLVLLVLLAYAVAAWALITRADRGWSRRRWMILIALVTLVNGFTWAVVTPPFHAADESQHFAYVETLANRGMPGTGVGAQEADLARLLKISMRHVALHPGNKPPWTSFEEGNWQKFEAAHRDDHSATDLTTAVQYPPIYYGVAVIPYKLTPGGVIAKDFGLRLFSILLTIGSALLVFLTVRELAPGRSWFAPVAGLLAAFQPMFLHLGAAAHLDPFVIFLSCLLIFLVAIVLRRGLDLPRALAIAVVAALAIAAKPISVGFVPGLLFVAGLAAHRDPRGTARAVRDLGIAALVGVAIIGIVYATFRTGAAVAGQATSSEGRFAQMTPKGFAGFVWEWFLPRLPSMFGWYDTNFWSKPPPFFSVVVPGFFANFNYLDTAFPFVVYRVIILIGVLLVVGCAIAALRYWAERARWLAFTVFAALAMLGTAVFLFFTAYALATGPGISLIQGRYLLPLITIYALFVVVGCLGLARRHAATLAILLVAASAMLNISGYALSLMRFYL